MFNAQENNKDVSAAVMPENAQTESVVPMMFDNFVLKRWLRSIGPVRRSEVLKKVRFIFMIELSGKLETDFCVV